MQYSRFAALPPVPLGVDVAVVVVVDEVVLMKNDSKQQICKRRHALRAPLTSTPGWWWR